MAMQGKNMDIDVNTKPPRRIPILVTLTVAFPHTLFIVLFGFCLLLTYYCLPFFSFSDPLAGLRLRHGIEPERGK